MGERHAAVGGEVLGDRRAGREVVHVQGEAVVLDQARGDAGAGEQPVEPGDGGVAAGGGEDLVERSPKRHHLGEIAGLQPLDAADPPSFDEGVEFVEAAERLLTACLGCGVDQVHDGGERVHHVMTKWHVDSCPVGP